MKWMATSITHLTDARYFAARGAHWLGFHAGMSTIEEVNAMKSWVDVPEFFLYIPQTASADLIWEWVGRTGMTNLLIDHLTPELGSTFPDITWMTYFHDSDMDESPASIFLIREEDLDKWFAREVKKSIQADLYVELSSMDSLPDLSRLDGFVVSGSQEDKTGLKSYDKMDEQLDRLEMAYSI